jgi:hypothetical protein
MNKNEQAFKNWLVNLLTEKGIWLTEGEQKELTDKLEKLGPPYTTTTETVINEEGAIAKRTRKKKE